MSRIACTIVAIVSCIATSTGRAELLLDISGLASGMPAESFSFGVRDYGHGGGGLLEAKVTDVNVARTVDLHSPDIFHAVVFGTAFPSATLSYCKGTCSVSTNYLTYLLDDAIVTSYASLSGGSLPREAFTLHFNTMTSAIVPTPTPPKSPWGAVLPATLPVGGQEPYDFDVFLDEAAAESVFDRPLSPLGDTLPNTLPNVSAVPEPASWLLLTIAVVASGVRRR